MLNLNVRSLLVSSCLVSFSFANAMAADFTNANALFAERDNSSKAEEARAAYAQLISGSSMEEKIYAVEQMGRIDYLVGSKLPENSDGNEKRKAIFKRCLDNQETINPKTTGVETPVFYYWKGVCLASWAKANGIVKSLEKSKELIETIETGKGVSATYEGGGFYRLGSVVYMNLPGLFGGNLEKAAEYAALAESAEAFEGALNPDTETGRYFYNLYTYKAQILAKQNNVSQAKATLQEAIARLNAGDIPAGREPETALHKVEIEATLAGL
jgi:hypothetical protein